MQTGRRYLLGAVVAAVALLAGCGGGDDPAPPKVAISRIVVAGDSLADVGTFNGVKFTVQNSADPANGFPIFPQLLAQDFGINSQCNFFVFTGNATAPFAANSRAGCTNFAVAGSNVRNPDAEGDDNVPLSIPFQLAAAARAVGGAYTPGDLVLVEGANNDAADLISSLIGVPGAPPFATFLLQELDAATVAATLPQPNGPATAAVLYMQKIADAYYGAAKVNALDKGATHVAIVDLPDITLTPRFQGAIAQVAATAGAATAANVLAIAHAAINGFNAQLRADVGTDARVAIVPFSVDFTEVVTHPADFGLTNVTGIPCARISPDLVFFDDPTKPARCTSAALDANPPAGLAAGWWQTWFFTDGFHPSPFAHHLLSNSVSRALARAGWL
jgi:phospholipase/lecithinase/hemolysin